MQSTSPTEPQTKPLSIDLIRTNDGTQCRASLSDEAISDYTEKWLSKTEFDPIDVFSDGKSYWLADGFHRIEAAIRAKRGSILCRVHPGTLRDAVLFAARANATHGVRRTNADKRKSVETLLRDKEWHCWSDRKIADHVGVSADLVATVRKQLSENDSSSAEAIPALQPRVGLDGKARKMPEPRSASLANSPSIPAGDPFKEAERLYGQLTNCLEDCHRHAPNQLHFDAQTNLDFSYKDFRNWKRAAQTKRHIDSGVECDVPSDCLTTELGVRA